MTPSWIQLLIVAVLIVLLFGRGKISGIMGDVAKGIKSFKKGMSDDAVSGTVEDPKSIVSSAKVKSSKVKEVAEG